MTTAEQATRSARFRSVSPRPASFDIAGSPWPTYKIDAVVAGLLTLMVVLLIAQSLQVAVLSAAAVAALTWIVQSVRQTTRSQ